MSQPSIRFFPQRPLLDRRFPLDPWLTIERKKPIRSTIFSTGTSTICSLMCTTGTWIIFSTRRSTGTLMIFSTVWVTGTSRVHKHDVEYFKYFKKQHKTVCFCFAGVTPSVYARFAAWLIPKAKRSDVTDSPKGRDWTNEVSEGSCPWRDARLFVRRFSQKLVAGTQRNTPHPTKGGSLHGVCWVFRCNE